MKNRKRKNSEKRELYESVHKKKGHFSFGENWKKYLAKLDKTRILEAQKSLEEFAGKNFRGKSFIDIGCGSGIFSLAAARMGARVISVDIDENSLDCARYLKKKYASKAKWEIIKFSALDPHISKLGKFDVVYSWGVLHHTGDMSRAFRNIIRLLKKDGQLYIAIYNNNEKYVFEGTSRLWARIKKSYNNSWSPVKKIIFAGYTAYLLCGITASFRNPYKYVKEYKTLRGMDFYTDIEDWLGGHPYEYASSDEIVVFFEKLDFTCIKVKKVRSLGCNEFLFRRK